MCILISGKCILNEIMRKTNVLQYKSKSSVSVRPPLLAFRRRVDVGLGSEDEDCILFRTKVNEWRKGIKSNIYLFTTHGGLTNDLFWSWYDFLLLRYHHRASWLQLVHNRQNNLLTPTYFLSLQTLWQSTVRPMPSHNKFLRDGDASSPPGLPRPVLLVRNL